MKVVTLMMPLAAGFVLAGCATRYQSKTGMGGGCSETSLGPGVYRVAYEANGATSANRVNDYLILRCARLTLEKGYQYFVFLGDSQSYDNGGIKYLSTVIRMYHEAFRGRGLSVLNAKVVVNRIESRYKLKGLASGRLLR